jgi:hypothetical protein
MAACLTKRPDIDLARPESWPVLLTLPEVAQIIARGVGGIRKQLQDGTFVPAPFATGPYRWRKDDVIRWLRNDQDVPRKRRQGA